MRFIHTADLHLGAPIAAADKRELLRRAGRSALSDMIAYAKEHKIKYFVIAGDLFDTASPDAVTLAAVRGLFESAPDITFLLIAGNHDPLTADGDWCGLKLPENVFLFGAAAGQLVTEEGCFIGQSLKAGQQGYGPISLPVSDGVRVAILHGTLQAGDPYTVDPAAIENPPDYLALGHIHKPIPARKVGKTTVENAGSPCAHGFDETGVRSFLDVTVDERGVLSTRVELEGVRFYEDSITLTAEHTPEEILEKIVAIAEGHRPEDIFRIRVKGESACLIPSRLSDYPGLAEIINDTLLPGGALQELAAQKTLTGYFVAGMLERLAGATSEEKELLQAALRLGLEALR